MESEANAAIGSAAGSLMGGQTGGRIPRREKTWDEMEFAQRMEKMREEVRYLRRCVTSMELSINSLKKHQHAQDGSLTIPLKSLENEDRPRGYFYDPLK